MSESRYRKVPELTAEKAYKLYNNDGMSYQQIADEFSDSDESISGTTVRSRVNAYQEGQQTVQEQPGEFGLTKLTEDEPDEENPFDMVACPACGEDMKPPETPGKHEAPCCGTVLDWDESETR